VPSFHRFAVVCATDVDSAKLKDMYEKAVAFNDAAH
jgi:hypothetical protein